MTVTPNAAEMMRRAWAFFSAGQLQQAEMICRQILTPKADNADALSLLGAIAISVRQFEFAEKCFRRSLQIEPRSAETLSNLAIVCRQTGRMGEAIDYFRQAVGMNPASPELLLNLGGAYRDNNQPDHAEAMYRQALKLRPDFVPAHITLATVLLRRGDFAQGWAEAEWRLKYVAPGAKAVTWPQPRWNGEPIEGKTILIHWEQGFGDTLQFCRYVPLVAERGAKVLATCQAPLVRLMRESFPQAQWFAPSDPLPPADLQCPLMSLPFVFGTDEQSIPSAGGYLRPNEVDAAKWREKLAGDPAKLKVGLAWQGNREYITDTQRSVAPALLETLGDLPGVQFYSLQKDPAEPPKIPLIDHTAELKDFADTAAFVSQLDVVIAVDTAVCHLTGALGKPLWLLLPLVPDWRWLTNRTDSPWYSSARLFSQTKFADWTDVIPRVRQALAERLK